MKRQLRRCRDGGLLFAGQPARSAEAPGHLHAAGSPTHLIDFALHHGLHGGVFHHLSQHSPVAATDDQHLGEESTENQPSAGAAHGGTFTARPEDSGLTASSPPGSSRPGDGLGGPTRATLCQAPSVGAPEARAHARLSPRLP